MLLRQLKKLFKQHQERDFHRSLGTSNVDYKSGPDSESLSETLTRERTECGMESAS